MIQLQHYHGKTIAILGLGKTGIAAARALKASGARVLLWDDKRESCEQLPVDLAQDVLALSDWDWSKIDALLLSPGIPLTHPAPHEAVKAAQANGVRITSDIELLHEACPDATYIAITGTNGKSTTTALIGHILKEAGKAVQVGGNIGEPVLAMTPFARHPESKAKDLSPHHSRDSSPSAQNDGVYVLELSSYQLDLLQNTHFNIAVWLNISPDHIDRHGDMEGYIAAKKQIFARQSAPDVAVIGVDDAYSEAVARELLAGKAARVVPISTTQRCAEGVWVKQGVLYDGQSEIDLAAMSALRGVHNHQNAAAAFAACRAAGVSPQAIEAAMRSFAGLAHRMQCIGEKDGVLFVNDSKATNADAAEKSLAAYDSIYWIAGGVPKAGGIAPLAPYFPRMKKAYLIGQAQDDFAKTLEGHVAYARCASLHEAVRHAYADAKAAGGGVVLLAPACASFDQFANFEHRGDAFCEAAEVAMRGQQTERYAQSEATAQRAPKENS